MTDVHVSGLHSATGRQWAALAREVEEVADIWVATECREDLGTLGRGQYRPDLVAAECSIFWRRAERRSPKDQRGHYWLTKKTFRTGKGRVRPGVVATWAMLPSKTDPTDRPLRIVAHFPSSVQRGNGFKWSQPRRVAAWQDALRGLVRCVTELQHACEPSSITVSADWNVDLQRPAWVNHINTELRNVGLVLVPPIEGTHGNRAIDAHAVQPPTVLARIPGFDHRPVAHN